MGYQLIRVFGSPIAVPCFLARKITAEGGSFAVGSTRRSQSSSAPRPSAISAVKFTVWLRQVRDKPCPYSKVPGYCFMHISSNNT